MKSEMEQYKMDNLDSNMGSEIEEYERDNLDCNIELTISHSTETEIAFKPTCRRCNEDASKEKLIRPCQCTGDWEFMHIRCLEIAANVRKRYSCMHCEVSFPLELKYKSLAQIYRNSEELCAISQRVCCAFLVVLCIVVYNLFMLFLFYTLIKLVIFGRTFIESLANLAVFIIIFALYVRFVMYLGEILQNEFEALRRVRCRWLAATKERKVTKCKLRPIHEV
ncbi:PREDICTED: E3 ubiquitin-protein ligase MARCH2-like [Wasmannia auropunctata]|uniref:E3 ubiquitin-protein ligase MARCH2-like n=1 Tax=Wasmannia auropunctata TaxID=64793 RepID=UPI0005EF67F3|nr:PREDICTED: E3 ubiquitin-protein ligase MARCH2-like [Wasmannia auropunctata]